MTQVVAGIAGFATIGGAASNARVWASCADRLVSLNQRAGRVGRSMMMRQKAAFEGGKMKQLSMLVVVVGALICPTAWGQ
jgi:hypothetical protein